MVRPPQLLLQRSAVRPNSSSRSSGSGSSSGRRLYLLLWPAAAPATAGPATLRPLLRSCTAVAPAAAVADSGPRRLCFHGSRNSDSNQHFSRGLFSGKSSRTSSSNSSSNNRSNASSSGGSSRNRIRRNCKCGGGPHSSRHSHPVPTPYRLSTSQGPPTPPALFVAKAAAAASARTQAGTKCYQRGGQPSRIRESAAVVAAAAAAAAATACAAIGVRAVSRATSATAVVAATAAAGAIPQPIRGSFSTKAVVGWRKTDVALCASSFSAMTSLVSSLSSSSSLAAGMATDATDRLEPVDLPGSSSAAAAAAAAEAAADPAEGGGSNGGGGKKVRVLDSVSVTAKEAQIFDTLRGAVEQFGLKTQLRVAGGWVRDKLLGRECFDIDVALDDMLGKDFAEKVNKYLHAKGETARGVGVIRSNPEQSKHLETATMMIHGQWIDFVNLRAESYAEGSRIPSAIEFGTAEQDAYRRDLTINSLFYNISTDRVEDLTGRGLSDLREGVIRTPLPPMQTFLDDPLRVLRAVRFGARFHFQLQQQLIDAARTEEVRTALANKVSRERFGKEVELMLKSRDPTAAMQTLCDLGLFSTVFALPLPPLQLQGGSDASAALQEFPRRCVEALDSSERIASHFHPRFAPLGAAAAATASTSTAQEAAAAAAAAAAATTAAATADEALLVGARLASVLLPLRHVCSLDKKKKQVAVSQHIVRESLKLKASYADTVVSLHTYAEAFQKLIPLLLRSSHGFHSSSSSPSEVTAGVSAAVDSMNVRIEAGKLLRKVKASWRSAVLLCAILGPTDSSASSSAAAAAAPAAERSLKRTRDNVVGSDDRIAAPLAAVGGGGGGGSGKNGGAWAMRGENEGPCQEELPPFSEERVAVRRRMQEWEQDCAAAADEILRLGLDGVWEKKPLVNGKDVINLLELGKGSPATGVWLEKAVEWQLGHPGGTEQQCREWLLETYRKQTS